MRPGKPPQEKAMYVAPQLDTSWLLTEQRKLYARSRLDHDYVFRKLWGLITDPRNLRVALARVARNRGRRTAGVDGVTVWKVLPEVDAFIETVRQQLRAGAFRPSPVRRVLIPKAGQPGKFRPLGIPTVIDRVVQAAVKNILEPVFEADFYSVSHGFRPGKSVHSALCHLRMAMLPRAAGPEGELRLPYQWAVEGDIKGCFDNIDHHGLMVRIRRRVGDAKVNRLVVAFLKAGIMANGQYQRTIIGTPQGGILSPLLANIALGVIEERYERFVRPRLTKPFPPAELETRVLRKANENRASARRRGRTACFPIRYADDFIILVHAPGPEQQKRAEETATQEKVAMAAVLKERMHLELSDTKTLVTPVTKPLRFLGHHVRVRKHPSNKRMVSTIVIPKDRSQLFRERIKSLFRRDTTSSSLEDRLRVLNPLLRGWSNFYRHAWGAKRILGSLDHYVWWTILRWVKKKHPYTTTKELMARYTWRKPGGRTPRWRGGTERVFEMVRTKVSRFRMGSLKPPLFATTSMESPVRTERRTPGSEGGARKPTGESR